MQMLIPYSCSYCFALLPCARVAFAAVGWEAHAKGGTWEGGLGVLPLALTGAFAARGLMKGRACRLEGGGGRGAGAACGRGGKASWPIGEPAYSHRISL